MKIEIHDASDRAAWLAMREQDVTASDVAAICGLDPYKTAMRVFAEKTKLIGPVGETSQMRRGSNFEEAAIAYLRQMRPTWELRRKPVYLRAPDLRIGATPDLIAIDSEREGHGVVQIKTIAARVFSQNWRGGAEEDEPGPTTAPLGYQLQTVTEGRLAQAKWGVLAALVVSEFDAFLEIVDVDITHEGAWSRITSEVDFFWRCVADGVMPPVDPEKDAETLRALYPQPKRLTSIDLSANNEIPALLDERDAIAAELKAKTERKAAIETIVKAEIGEFESALIADGRVVKWKVEPRAGHPVPPSNPRVFRVSKGSPRHASTTAARGRGIATTGSQQPALDFPSSF